MTPHNVRIFLYTEREGMLSAVGHDLKLSVGRFEIDEVSDGYEVVVEADSIAVAGCIVNGREETVSAGDRATIEKNLKADVLRVKQFRHIEFTGAPRADGDGYVIEGTLRLVGKEGKLSIPMNLSDGTWRGDVEIDQRDFGIKPYTAFLGALRIKPHVRVELLADA